MGMHDLQLIIIERFGESLARGLATEHKFALISQQQQSAQQHSTGQQMSHFSIISHNPNL